MLIIAVGWILQIMHKNIRKSNTNSCLDLKLLQIYRLIMNQLNNHSRLDFSDSGIC